MSSNFSKFADAVLNLSKQKIAEIKSVMGKNSDDIDRDVYKAANTKVDIKNSRSDNILNQADMMRFLQLTTCLPPPLSPILFKYNAPQFPNFSLNQMHPQTGQGFENRAETIRNRNVRGQSPMPPAPASMPTMPISLPHDDFFNMSPAMQTDNNAAMSENAKNVLLKLINDELKAEDKEQKFNNNKVNISDKAIKNDKIQGNDIVTDANKKVKEAVSVPAKNTVKAGVADLKMEAAEILSKAEKKVYDNSKKQQNDGKAPKVQKNKPKKPKNTI